MALTAEQLDLHRDHIGGSMAPIIAGVSPRMTARELYEVMRGNLPEPEGDPVAAMLGHAIEPAAHRWYEAETGRELQRAHKTRHHRAHPRLIAHIDRRARRERRLVEIKMRQHPEGWGAPGTDDVPDEVICQVQHYLGVLGRGWPVADVVLLLRGIEFRRYEVPRDPGIIETLFDQELEFLARLDAADPPEIDHAHPSAVSLLERLHPGTNGRIVELEESDAHWAAVYLDAAEHEARYRRVRDEARAHLLERIGDGAMGMLPDGSAFSRKRVNRGAYEVGATTYMGFQHRKPPRASA